MCNFGTILRTSEILNVRSMQLAVQVLKSISDWKMTKSETIALCEVNYPRITPNVLDVLMSNFYERILNISIF